MTDSQTAHTPGKLEINTSSMSQNDERCIYIEAPDAGVATVFVGDDEQLALANAQPADSQGE